MKFSHCVDVFSGLPRFLAAQHVFCNQWQHLLCHDDPRVLLILEVYLLQFLVILQCMSGVTFQRKFLTTCNIFVLILKHFPWNMSTAWMWKYNNLTSRFLLPLRFFREIKIGNFKSSNVYHFRGHFWKNSTFESVKIPKSEHFELLKSRDGSRRDFAKTRRVETFDSRRDKIRDLKRDRKGYFRDKSRLLVLKILQVETYFETNITHFENKTRLSIS